MTVRLTRAQARALGAALPPELAPPAPQKYRAKPVREAGRYYASTAERDYVAEVFQLAAAGIVTDVVLQPVVRLVAGVTYRADVAFTDAGGRRVWVDVKGVVTDRFRLIQKLWRHSGPGLLRVVKRRGTRAAFVTVREIPGGGAEAT